ncbi:UxaA family hydrolase [bacterium]|nr:UxaA family hydrolase [bacterium]
MMTFSGYRRKNGTVGIRNHVLIFPTVICASAVADKISRLVPGTVTVSHPHGCGHIGQEKDHMIRVMSGVCNNPNVSGVLLVGLGCEMLTPELIAEQLEKNGQRYEMLSVQAEGGTTASIEKGKVLASRLVAESMELSHEPIELSELILGTKCGGSDTLSGLTANPALGVACDLIVEQGGTVLLTEIPEIIGAEHILAKRAVNEDVGHRIIEIAAATENSVKELGVDIRESEPSPGNKAGGLTTLEEKSLGAILKAGTSTVNQVIEFAEKPTAKGLVIMDGPAQDAVVGTGYIAAGTQIIVFTTGRGTPLGTPVAPVIKVSSNSDIYRRMKDNIDLNAGKILEGTESIQSFGEEILKEIIAVASGEKTRSEILEHHEFAIHSIGPTV